MKESKRIHRNPDWYINFKEGCALRDGKCTSPNEPYIYDQRLAGKKTLTCLTPCARNEKEEEE